MKNKMPKWTLLLSGLVLSVPLEAETASKAELHRIHVSHPQELRDLFAYSEERMPLVSAHRGGAIPGYPENCIATFENTLNYAYSMLEIDLRYSKDGHIVLHHDSTLERTTTGSGLVKDLTLAELKHLKLKDKEGTVTDYRMPTLGETIEWARGKTILILDRKNEVSVETCVRIIKEYKAQAHVMIMVSKMEDIKAVYDLDPDIMMEVFLGTHERFQQFDQTGVPWDRIIPFISHQPPEDRNLINMIHAKGSSCMAGSSRYLDRELKTLGKSSPEMKNGYRKLLKSGIDIIETDLPIQVTELIYQNTEAPQKKARFFR